VPRCPAAATIAVLTTVAISAPLYFPPTADTAGESVSPSSLGWHTADSLDSLYSYLAANNTRAFIVLKGGRIALERASTAMFDIRGRLVPTTARPGGTRRAATGIRVSDRGLACIY